MYIPCFTYVHANSSIFPHCDCDWNLSASILGGRHHRAAAGANIGLGCDVSKICVVSMVVFYHQGTTLQNDWSISMFVGWTRVNLHVWCLNLHLSWCFIVNSSSSMDKYQCFILQFPPSMATPTPLLKKKYVVSTCFISLFVPPIVIDPKFVSSWISQLPLFFTPKPTMLWPEHPWRSLHLWWSKSVK